jgi:hypothetical protein
MVQWECECLHEAHRRISRPLRSRATRELEHRKPDLFICGHSHIARVMRDEKLALPHINPGASGHAAGTRSVPRCASTSSRERSRSSHCCPWENTGGKVSKRATARRHCRCPPSHLRREHTIPCELTRRWRSGAPGRLWGQSSI